MTELDPIDEGLGVWSPLSVAEIGELFEGVAIPWWIAGGLAIDLFVGHMTRPHHDADVEVLRRDQSMVPAILDGWDPDRAALKLCLSL